MGKLFTRRKIRSVWWIFLVFFIRLSFPFLFTEKELLAYKMREKDGVLVDGDSDGKMDCILYLRGKTSITIVLITTFFPCFHN